MTDSDVFAFTALAKRVGIALGKRVEFEDFKALTGTYFRVLRRYDLGDLERGADIWIARETRFPKPAEWASAIPRQEADCRVMSQNEAIEYARAEKLGYEGESCSCPECIDAGVNEKSLRFVPECVGDADVRVKNPFTDRIVTAGHWAHGWELFRYYDAKADFYNTCLELGLRRNVLTPKDSVTRPHREFTSVQS